MPQTINVNPNDPGRLTPDEMKILQAAIATAQPNQLYRELSYQGVKIQFGAPMYIRESTKHAGKRQLMVHDRILGEGSYGIAENYRKIYLEPDRIHSKAQDLDGWVIKQLKEYDTDEERQAFAAECQLMQRLYPEVQFDLKHGTVVMPNFGVEFESTFLFSERYTETNDFSKRLQFFSEYLRSVACIHAQGIVHQDLKPQNMCLNQQNNVTRINVFDFGLSWDQGQYQNIRGGTARYAPPEQWQGGIADYRQDVFASAIVMLDVVMGAFDSNDRAWSETLLNLDGEELRLVHNPDAAFYQDIEEALKGSLRAYPEIVDAHQIDFFSKLFTAALRLDVEERITLKQFQFGTRLLSLNEKQLQFLKGEDVKLSDREAVQLSSLLKEAHKYPKMARVLELHAPNIDVPSVLNALPDVDVSKLIQEYSDTALEESIMLKIFQRETPSQINETSHIGDPHSWAANYKLHKQQLMAKADEISHRLGMSYEDKQITDHLCQDAFILFQAQKTEVAKLEFFRYLPKEAQSYVREQYIATAHQKAAMLLSGFHKGLSSDQDAGAFLEDKPDNHFVLFKTEQGDIRMAIKKDNKVQCEKFALVESGSVICDRGTFKTIDDFYQGTNASPVVEHQRAEKFELQILTQREAVMAYEIFKMYKRLPDKIRNETDCEPIDTAWDMYCNDLSKTAFRNLYDTFKTYAETQVHQIQNEKGPKNPVVKMLQKFLAKLSVFDNYNKWGVQERFKRGVNKVREEMKQPDPGPSKRPK